MATRGGDPLTRPAERPCAHRQRRTRRSPRRLHSTAATPGSPGRPARPVPSRSAHGWSGTLPELHAAPALTAIPSRSSAITCASARTPGSASAGGVGQPRRRRRRTPRAMPHRGGLGAIPQRGEPALIARRMADRGEPGDGGQRRRAAAAAALLPAARDQRRDRRHLRRQQQRARTGRPAQLVRGQRDRVAPRTRPDRPAIRPAACTASTCSSAPCVRHSAAASAIGWIVPVSLLASIRQTRAGGPDPSQCRKTSRSATPWRSTGSTAAPEAARSSRSSGASDTDCRAAAARTASCSVAPTMMRRPRPRACIARASASVPPEVNTTSWSRAPNRAASAPAHLPARAAPRGRRRAPRMGCR